MPAHPPVEAVTEIQAGVGEGPLWDEGNGELWGVDIFGKAIHRHCPASGREDSCLIAREPGCLVLAENGSPVVAAEDGVFDRRRL